MELKSRIRRLLLRLLLLVVALGAFTAFINLAVFDEPLHPDILALGTPAPVGLQGNAYPLVYGLAAADDRDARAAGEAVIRSFRESFRRGESISLSDDQMNEIFGGSELDAAWQAALPSLTCNTRLSLSCADSLVRELEQVGTEHPRIAVQRARFDEILRQPRFAEIQEMAAETPLPRYDLLMQLSRLRLGISLQSDSTAAFLANAHQDLEFWRRMLRDGDSLVAKMVALAGIRNNLGFLSFLMRERALEDQELAILRDFVRPLTSDERDIGETFLAEQRLVLLSFKEMVVLVGEPSLFDRLTVQEHATLNENYLTMTVPLQLRASLTAAEFYAQRAYEPLTYTLRVFPPPLFNLGGKRILRRWTAASGAQDYITRVHDLAARLPLVLLQAEIEERGRERIQELLESSPYTNPYTGAAFEYDPQEETIGFECLSNSSDVCSVRIASR